MPIAAPAEALSATIGPEGGTLAGRADTLFEGVRLVIPPGALPSRTTVRVVPIIDETPLPPLAERVGQHYRIEPLGTALAIPASLTLPVTTGRVAAFGQGASDVKVWARTDGAFRIVEASATAEGTVTIPVSQFNVAAAGVQTTASSTLACEAGDLRCIEAMSAQGAPDGLITRAPCIAASPGAAGFCVDPIAVPPSVLSRNVGFLVESEVLYVPTTHETGAFVWRRTDLRQPVASVLTTQTSNPVPQVPTEVLSERAVFVRRAAPEGLGAEEVWSSHRLNGNLRSRFGPQSSTVFIPDLRNGRGMNVVRTQNGTLVSLGATHFIATDADGAGTPVAIPALAVAGGIGAPSVAPSDGIWLGGSLTTALSQAQEETQTASVFGFRAASPPVAQPAAIALPRITAEATSGPSLVLSLNVNPRDGRVLVSGVRNRPPASNPSIGHGVWVGAPGGTATPVLLQTSLVAGAAGSTPTVNLGAAVWGSDDAIWIPNYASPEIFVIDPGGARSTVVLARPGTPEFVSRRPVFVRALADRSVIVVTTSGAFFRIRRAEPCAAGTGDCDRNAANGCETNTATDPSHCGACGTACTFAYATGVCVAGSCALGTCNAGFANCDGDASNGCERRTSDDAANCGGCGVTCAARATCERGVCLGTSRIASGSTFNCARLPDGTAQCWGDNRNGELGDGTRASRHTPAAVSGLVGVAEVVAGRVHSCARLTDGTVRCWGLNINGALGSGSDATSLTPVTVRGLVGAAQVVAGSNHTCARLTGGTVQCWGSRHSLGNGGGDRDSNVPVAVVGLSGVVEIAGGGGHTCARLIDRTVQCWGENFDQELGDGTAALRLAPVPVLGITSAAEIAAGSLHTCARLTDGSVQCWGALRFGALGRGTLGGVGGSNAMPVLGLTGAVELAAHGLRTCARLLDHSMRCWGTGILGDGSSAPRPSPVAVLGLADAEEIAVGDDHICARSTTGAFRCWGSNGFGQLGTGVPNTRSAAPITVPGLANVADLASGENHTCARLGDGSVRCWGENSDGQLGDGTEASRASPVAVSGLSGVEQMAPGHRHTCAVLTGGGARCWGRNEFGQLGDGSTTSRLTPASVLGFADAAEITAGFIHTCAHSGGGAVRCWGNNSVGQLGTGTPANSSTPLMVGGVGIASALASGNHHTCALSAFSRDVRCWGRNSVGQIGNGGTATSAPPSLVRGLTAVEEIAAGGDHGCARRDDGTVRCWGENASGELGDGTREGRSLPVPVAGLVGAVEIAAGGDHTCARLTNGTVRCWGRSVFGQCGNNLESNPRPVEVAGLANVATITAGGNHTCARLIDGTARCWGLNTAGQLGDGANNFSLLPTVVPGISLGSP